jgi:hypothetical protein
MTSTTEFATIHFGQKIAVAAEFYLVRVALGLLLTPAAIINHITSLQ